jgi:hypothetical protein
MAGDGINPYESPRLATERRTGRKRSLYVHELVRVLTMGLIGYGAFAAVGLLYLAVSEFFQLEIFPSLRWALVDVGGVGAAVCAGSEIFNSGRGSASGVARRILAAAGVFVGSAFGASALSVMVGWQPMRYSEDPFWLHRLVLVIVSYFAGLVLVRIVWIVSLRQEKGRG